MGKSCIQQENDKKSSQMNEYIQEQRDEKK